MTFNWTTGLAAAAGAIGGGLIASIGAKQLGKSKHAGTAGALGVILGAGVAAALAAPAAPATTTGTGTAGLPMRHPMGRDISGWGYDHQNPQLSPHPR